MKKILLLGAGNMGSALLGGGLSSGALHPEKIYVRDKNPEKVAVLQKKWGIHTKAIEDADIVVLAVKPQAAASVFPVQTAKNPLLISVLAGTTTQTLRALSGISAICRSMPNTPALVSRGMTGLFFSSECTEEQKKEGWKFFSGCGKSVEVTNEKEMHAITAVSGSGPAYFFQFVEHLIAAGIDAGLEKKTAELLATETFLGAATLLKKSGKKASDLRAQVTSPNGTTAAALESFSKNNFSEVVKKAVIAAKKRSAELGA